jgi:hypothetical protein
MDLFFHWKNYLCASWMLLSVIDGDGLTEFLVWSPCLDEGRRAHRLGPVKVTWCKG